MNSTRMNQYYSRDFFFLIFKIIVETDLVEKETLGLIHVLNIVFEMIYTTIL